MSHPFSGAAAGSPPTTEVAKFFDLAHAGAHVRALAEYVAQGQFTDLLGAGIRSVIVVTSSSEDAAVVRLVVGALNPPCPVLASDQLPNYAGPLDVVLVSTDGSLPAEKQAEEAMHVASRRGARTILVHGSSDLREEAAAEVLPAPPHTGRDAHPVRLMYALVAVVKSLAFDKRVVAEELERVADVLDEDLLALSPDRDIAVNAARQLRVGAADACVLHTAAQNSIAIAEVIARMWQRRGFVCFAADAAVLEAFGQRAPETPRIFDDPFSNEGDAMLPLKVVVWGAEDAPMFPFAQATYTQHCPDAGLGEGAPPAGLGEVALAARLMVRAAAATIFELDE